jgi:protein-L-isoaspartate(D-aspartate) O-methyltransferase (PCMT)
LHKNYYHLARPQDGIFRLDVAGVSGRFYIRAYGHLRLLESWGGAGGGEKHLLELLISRLHPADTVYDIGANIGLYTVLLAKAVGDQGLVIAFEPNSQIYTQLEENVDFNSLPNVRCFRQALGERSAEGKLYIDRMAMGAPRFMAGRGERIQSTKLWGW